MCYYDENTLLVGHHYYLAALERTTELDVKDKDQKTKMYEMLGRFGIALINP